MKRLLWITSLSLILIAAITPVNPVNAQNVITTNGVAPSGNCPTNGDWSFSGDLKITECYTNTWTTFSGAGGGGNSSVVSATEPLVVTSLTAGNTTTYTVAVNATTGTGNQVVLSANATLTNPTLAGSVVINGTGYAIGNGASPMTFVTTIPAANITGLGTMSVLNNGTLTNTDLCTYVSGTGFVCSTATSTYQQALTLTTTGSSGAATLSGGALNIPLYSGGTVTQTPKPVTNVADAAWGVSTSNNATVNQSDFAAIATAVNNGTTPAYIWLPEGTYNVLSTGSNALGTYTVPVTFHCADPINTIINQSGTGNLIQIGPTGLSQSTASNTISRFENCQIEGGASSGADGIIQEPWMMTLYVNGNYWTNYGNSSSYAIHSIGPNFLYASENFWLPRDNAASHNFLLHSDPSVLNINLDDISRNYFVCFQSATSWQTSVCGIGVWVNSGSGEDIHDNTCSGPSPCIRISEAGVGTSTIVHDNYLENFNTDQSSSHGDAIEIGATSGSQTVAGVDIHDNMTYCNNSSDYLVGGTPGGTNAVTNSLVLNNFTRSYGNCAGVIDPNLGNGGGLTLASNVNLSGNNAAYAATYQDATNFSGTSGTALSSYTDTYGYTWELCTACETTQQIPVLSGSSSAWVTGTASTYPYNDVLSTLTPSSPNYTSTLTFNYLTTNSYQSTLLVRQQGPSVNTYYSCACVPNGGGSNCAIGKDVAGTYANLSTFTYTWTAGQQYTESCRVYGSSSTVVTFSINGAQVSTATDSSSPITPAGQTGFRIPGGSEVSVTGWTVQ